MKTNLEGQIISVCEQYGYVVVNEFKIYFILFLNNLQFLPLLYSKIKLENAHVIDKRNIFLCENSKLECNNWQIVDESNYVYLKSLKDIINTNKLGMLDVIKIEEIHQIFMKHICFLIKPIEELVIQVLKDKLKYLKCTEKCYSEQCFNNILIDLKYTCFKQWLCYKVHSFDKFNEWTFSVHNFENTDILIGILTVNCTYKHFMLSDIHGSMLCLVTNQNGINLQQYLYKILYIKKYIVIVENFKNKSLICYFIFDINDVIILDDSIECLPHYKSVSKSKQPEIEIFQKYLITLEDVHCWFEFNSLKNSNTASQEDNLKNKQQKVQSNKCRVIDSSENLKLIEIKDTMNYLKCTGKIIHFEGIVLNKTVLNDKCNIVFASVGNKYKRELHNVPSNLIGIIPHMRMLVKNIFINNSKFNFSLNTSFHLLSFNPINRIDSINLFTCDEWTSPLHIGVHDKNLPTGIYVRIKPSTLFTYYINIKVICKTCNNVYRINCCPILNNVFEFNAKFKVGDINGESIMLTQDSNFLRCLLRLNEKKWEKWLKDFENISYYERKHKDKILFPDWENSKEIFKFALDSILKKQNMNKICGMEMLCRKIKKVGPILWYATKIKPTY